MTSSGLFDNLRLPLMCAPMSIASAVPLAVECCKAGILGGWQGGTYTPMDEFEAYLDGLAEVDGASPIVNLPARIATEPTGPAKLDLLEKHKAPLILSSLGDPSAVIERAHGWGGKVIQDVTTMRHAKKALSVGADGLMLTCSGAGGHTGFITPFAFVPAVRKIFDGPLIVAGGIADGMGVAGALALGADIACMGTRFIATPESGVPDGHRTMIPESDIDEIVVSAAMNGVPANWMRRSIEQVGLDYKSLPQEKSDMPEGVIPWLDIWSAGQSVGLIDAVKPVAELVDQLAEEFEAAHPARDWRARLASL